MNASASECGSTIWIARKVEGVLFQPLANMLAVSMREKQNSRYYFAGAT